MLSRTILFFTLIQGSSRFYAPLVVIRSQVFFYCDGIRDCKDGSDESTKTCLGARLEQFDEQQYRMLHPEGYKLPDKIRYKTYWDKYLPKLVDLPYAGNSTASVEMYYLQAPLWHDNSLPLFESWFVQQSMRFLNMYHAGIGLLFRDEKGQELSRVSMQYWSAKNEVPDNPNLLPNKTLSYNAAGQLLIDGRAVLTYSRSRGIWEGGYWTENILLKSLNVREYNKKLPWINEWLVHHQQFTWMGLQDTKGNILIPKVDCDRFARDMVKEFTGEDVVSSEGVYYLVPLIEVDVIEGNVDSRRVKELLDGEESKRMANNADIGGSFGIFRGYASYQCKENPELSKGDRDWFCQESKWKVDSNILLISPISYKPDSSPFHSEEFASRVHIVRPTGKVIVSEVSNGFKIQNNFRTSLSYVIRGIVTTITFFSICWCFFSFVRRIECNGGFNLQNKAI